MNLYPEMSKFSTHPRIWAIATWEWLSDAWKWMSWEQKMKLQAIQKQTIIITHHNDVSKGSTTLNHCTIPSWKKLEICHPAATRSTKASLQTCFAGPFKDRRSWRLKSWLKINKQRGMIRQTKLEEIRLADKNKEFKKARVLIDHDMSWEKAIDCQQ